MQAPPQAYKFWGGLPIQLLPEKSLPFELLFLASKYVKCLELRWKSLQVSQALLL